MLRCIYICIFGSFYSGMYVYLHNKNNDNNNNKNNNLILTHLHDFEDLFIVLKMFLSNTQKLVDKLFFKFYCDNAKN